MVSVGERYRRMQFSIGFVAIFCAALCGTTLADNRTKAAELTVTLGVTFYTASELEEIFKCCEDQIYATPDNQTAILQEVKSCVVNNSGDKALSALKLYNNANSCLDPKDLMDVANEHGPMAKKLIQPLLNKCVKNIKKCKKNNTDQETCLQANYGYILNTVNKKYVNTVCTKLVKQNVTADEWTCGKKYIPEVMNTDNYSCFKLTL